MDCRVKPGNDAERFVSMKHSAFRIGCEFVTATGRWRCTDIGKCTVAAIRLDLDHDPSWYEGPPYAVVEHLFDEDGMRDCEPAPRQRTYDDSGRARIVRVKPVGARRGMSVTRR
jgi:hypothetical protein